MFKKNYFVKSVIFSFVLLSAIIFSCDKKNIIEDDLDICINSFELLNSENERKNLGSDIISEINAQEHTISLTVPHIAELTGLKFNIKLCEGTTISPASGEEVNFEVIEESTEEETTKKPSPQRYKKIFTLTKGGTQKEYTVIITRALSSDCSISSFELKKTENNGKIFGDRVGQITKTDGANTITLHVSDAANLDDLTPTIIHTGAIITSGEVVSTTENSITTTTVNYTVTAEDGKTTKVYAVKYVKSLSSDNRISKFEFKKESNVNDGLKLTRSSIAEEGKTVDVTIDNSAGTVKVKVSTEAYITDLIPTITRHTSATISPEIAAHNYSNGNKVYTITAEDGQTKQYTVSIATDLSNAKEISSFKLEKSKNETKIFGDREGVITESTDTSTITLHVSDAATLTDLKPTIIHTGASITSGEVVSTTVNSITTTTVSYTVTAADGKTKVYEVKYVKDLSSNNRISKFEFKKENNVNDGLKLTRSSAAERGKTADVTIDNSAGTIKVKVSTAATITALTPTITKHASATISPAEGIHDYATSKTYTITAQDGQTKQYTVSVFKDLSNTKDISSFKFEHAQNGDKGFNGQDYGGTINNPSNADWEGTITIAKMPHTITNLTGLKPTIAISASATVNPAAEVVQNFTRGTAVVYTVTAQDGTTRNYNVTIGELSAMADITSFKIKQLDHSIIAPNVTTDMTISPTNGGNDYTIVLDGEDDNDVKLKPEIVVSPSATVNPASGAETTFTYGIAQTYTVTAENGATKVYSVTVKSSNSKMKSFKFKTSDVNNSSKRIVQDVTGVIDHGTKTVTVNVAHDAELNGLTPHIELCKGASISPEATTPQDFSSEKTYTVTAQDGKSTANYAVTVYTLKKEFISKWRTNRTYEKIQLPIYDGGDYDFIVDWGDGTEPKRITNDNIVDASHMYLHSGEKTITITGKIEGFNFGEVFKCNAYNSSIIGCADAEKIIGISSWGELKFGNRGGYFDGCKNLTFLPLEAPNLEGVTNMNSMFRGAINFNQNIGNWNVSNVTSMYRMFMGATFFNQNLNNWNVSNVQMMNSMFLLARFFNQNLNNWNVSNVKDMEYMFAGATDFNQDLSSWNVSNVQIMEAMFSGATAFNKDLSSWNVSNVKYMRRMFEGATSFNQNIGSWNVSRVSSMSEMFRGAINFNQNIGNWNVSNVEDMEWMFTSATAFNQDISSWNVSNVMKMDQMFKDAVSFNQNISKWDLCKSMYSMGLMFSGATSFKQDLSKWKVPRGTSMIHMFENSGMPYSGSDKSEHPTHKTSDY
ncbi:BspA family leucine-rich repeat surface protein [Ichthyobacterium seriolicida]|uniref:Transmembrane protein n=1 Tax=Ichthyobacterium seriolicida TaxID=242600 RepID=A0A1J1E9P2_9FLAO|nr:BspA family leucine-rich repeat surface protein [Ichthyobacterium seriolicida]BAV94248.1 transmembrane protein [Ichthyobacterium seriolicida]